MSVTNLERALVKIGQELVDTLKDNLERSNNNASRNLTQSITYEAKVLPSKNGLAFGFRFALFMDDYYIFVDKGRKAGKRPPIASIMQWIIEKPIKYVPEQRTPRKKVTGTQRLKLKANKAVRAKGSKGTNKYKGLAYLIAKKIGEKGTKGSKFYSSYVNQKYFDTFVERVENAMFEDMEDAVLQVAEEQITNITKT